MKRMLVVTGHPDDESFGVGATIAKYAAAGVKIHLLCATRGEAGMWSDVKPEKGGVGPVREREHKRAVKILGVESLEYLGYIDGEISNNDVERIAERILEKLKKFKPDIVLTFDPLGISGHLDHIAMAMAATKAFDESPNIKKLYYFTVLESLALEMWQKHKRKIWARKAEEITTKIEVDRFLAVKIKAALEHKTQRRDIERLLPFWKKYGETDNFVLGGSRVRVKLPEKDLFAGI